MNRIEERMKNLRESGKKAFITYITAGLPNLEKTKEIIKAQYEAGLDVVELGIPFSDPVADGPVIQNASYRAIQNGVTLKKCFDMVEELRRECEIPLVFMMYYNTILHYGPDEFAERCKNAGVDGLIVPDLPFEEQDELKAALDRAGNATLLLQLVSPVSADRIPMIVENARGFVYCVSSMGVTGQAAQFHKDVRNYLTKVKSAAKIPVMMGFGIRTAADIEPFEDIIDGAIVGSHFINLMEENDFAPEAAAEYVRNFKEEM